MHAPGILYTSLQGTYHHYTVLPHYNYLHTSLSHTLNTLAAGNIYYSSFYGMEKAQKSSTNLITAMTPTKLTHCTICFILLKTMLQEAITNLQLSPLTPSPNSFQLKSLELNIQVLNKYLLNGWINLTLYTRFTF